MKPLLVLVLVSTCSVSVNSGASSAVAGSHWRSSTTAATAEAASTGRARTPSAFAGATTTAAALWPRRTLAARIPRGGGGSSTSNSSGSRSSVGDAEGAGGNKDSNPRDINLEPAPRRGGGVDGSAGERGVDHSGRGEQGAEREPPSKPAASEAAPRQEQKGDAKENALREALILADGPNKILREVERIPALRRLSDSALRVTSATPADGRLAALALYRLGAEARAAESASATAAAAAAAAESASSSGAATSIESAALSEGGERGGQAGSGASDGAAGAGAGAAASASAEGQAGGELGGGGSVSPASPEGRDEADGAGARAGVAGAPSDSLAAVAATAAADNTKNMRELQTRDRVDPGAAASAAADPAGPEASEQKQQHGSGPAGDGTERAEEGAAESPAVAKGASEGAAAAAAAAAASCKESEPEKEGAEQEHASSEAEAEAATAAASTPAAFDKEHIKSDQRFEQLVEIVECVAGELSVSDISKVVWGLSILGHVPRNSLLESLAGLLTDRFRRESGGAPEDAAETTGGGGGGGERAADAGSVMAADGGPGEREREREGQGSAEDRPAGGDGTLGAGGGAGGDKQGGDEDGGGTGGGMPRATEAEAREKAVGTLTTSGTDLATAALSFAYAHARLDISTGELLEVIAACATPQLKSTPLRDLANLAWAFAVQGQLHTQMMKGVGREVVSGRAVGHMTAKDASIFAWAYGMLGLRPGRVIRALTREGLATVQEATPQDLSNLAWGLARAGLAGSGGDDFDGEEEKEWEGEGDGVPGGGPLKSSTAGGVDDTRAQGEEEEGEENAEEARMLQGKHGSGGSGANGTEGGAGGGGGPWGLGWMRGRRRGRPRGGDDDPRQEEEEEQEEDEGQDGRGEGKEEEEFLEVEVSTANPDGAAGGDASPKASRRQGDVELSVEQGLGEALLARASDSFLQFQPKQLSRLCWALGAWQSQGVASLLPEAGLFAARALSEAGQRPKEYTAEELAQVLWAFATLVGNADSSAQELAGLVGALAEGFESEGAGGPLGGGGGGVGSGGGGGLDAATACDVLWSFATIGYPAHSLCEAMARDLVDKVSELPPSSVSSLVWAYAKMGHPSAELMERVLSVVERRLDDFSVEEAVTSLWALGALGYTVSLKRQFYVTEEDLQSLSPSATANLLWGLAKTEAAFADSFDRECLEVVAADMGHKLLSFSPRELCRTAWALGRLGLGGIFGPGSLLDADGGGESEDGGHGSAALDGGEMSGLMDKLLGECSKWLEIFTPQDLETLLWAICRLEHRADALVAEMAKEGRRRQDELPSVLKQSGPSAARDAAFHLGAFRHLLAKYRSIDFDGLRKRGRYRRGKSMLSRMFRER
eukprot:g14232.t1